MAEILTTDQVALSRAPRLNSHVNPPQRSAPTLTLQFAAVHLARTTATAQRQGRPRIRGVQFLQHQRGQGTIQRQRVAGSHSWALVGLRERLPLPPGCESRRRRFQNQRAHRRLCHGHPPEPGAGPLRVATASGPNQGAHFPGLAAQADPQPNTPTDHPMSLMIT